MMINDTAETNSALRRLAMSVRIFIAASLIIIGGAAAPPTSFAYSGTAAVLPFTDNSGKRLGDLATDAMTASLSDAAIFQLVGRDELTAAIKNSRYGLSSSTGGTALKTGRLVNADYIIVGRIDAASMNKNDFIFAQQYDAVVKISVKIISSFTGQIICSASADGTDQNVKLKGLGAKADYGNAVEDAIEKITGRLRRSYPVYAKIAAISGGDIYISAGSQSGVKTGDSFIVYEEGAPVIDPDTGKNLTVIRKKIAEIKIIRVEDNAAVGQLKEGSQIKIGQTAVKEDQHN